MDVVCLGELLVDMIAEGDGPLRDATAFRRYPGGSAGNVAVGLQNLGLSAGIITRLGDDAFGDFLVETMKFHGVDTRWVRRDPLRRTTLAFVSLDSGKVPDYVFYRHPSASMFLQPRDVDSACVRTAHILYTSSMSLVNRPIREAVHRAVRIARRAGTLVAFDVNLRRSLWSSKSEARERILRFIRRVDILKIDRGELDFLVPDGATEDQVRALRSAGRPALVAVTRGAEGATFHHGDGPVIAAAAFELRPEEIVDTTGAGDAFMAALLASVAGDTRRGKAYVADEARLREIGRLTAAAAALVIQRPGVIPALPTREELSAMTGQVSDAWRRS